MNKLKAGAIIIILGGAGLGAYIFRDQLTALLNSQSGHVTGTGGATNPTTVNPNFTAPVSSASSGAGKSKPGFSGGGTAALNFDLKGVLKKGAQIANSVVNFFTPSPSNSNVSPKTVGNPDYAPPDYETPESVPDHEYTDPGFEDPYFDPGELSFPETGSADEGDFQFNDFEGFDEAGSGNEGYA